MNRIIITSLIIFSALFLFSFDTKAQCNEQLVHECALTVGDNATYMKDFRVKLKRGRRGKPAPVARFSVVLNKGVQYRFNLCKAVEFEGEPVLQLYDTNRLLGSTIDITTGDEYKSFDFICQKSAIYQVFISFKEGKEGCAVGILSIVR